MKIKKQLKDYPSNVPRKLFRLLKECNFNRSILSAKLKVNSGYVSNLLNKGIEPTDTTPTGRQVRKKLFLKVYKQNKKNLHRTIQRQPQPEYMKKWGHLEKEERHKTIKTYIEWKEKQGDK